MYFEIRQIAIKKCTSMTSKWPIPTPVLAGSGSKGLPDGISAYAPLGFAAQCSGKTSSQQASWLPPVARLLAPRD